MTQNESGCVKENLCSARREVIIDRLNSMDKQDQSIREDLERRLQGLNELRQEVQEDRNQFVPRAVYDIKMELLDKVAEKVVILETKAIVWFAVLSVLLIIAQIIIVAYFKSC